MVATRNPRKKGLLSRKATSGLQDAVLAVKGAGKKQTELRKAPSEKAKETKKIQSATGRGSVKKVRVWWPPTKSRARTDFAGMYWPAEILDKTAKGYRVQYDNGDKDLVDRDQVSPAEHPTEFGKEEIPLHVGEFVEVHNNSKTDPAAWIGVIKKVQGSSFVVSYPFHDAEDEVVKGSLIRRCRVFEEHDNRWNYVIPGQTWKDGEVTSPLELAILETEEELLKHLGMTKKSSTKSSGTPRGRGRGNSVKEEEVPGSAAEETKPRRGRPPKAGVKEDSKSAKKGTDAEATSKAEDTGSKRASRRRVASNEEAASPTAQSSVAVSAEGVVAGVQIPRVDIPDSSSYLPAPGLAGQFILPNPAGGPSIMAMLMGSQSSVGAPAQALPTVPSISAPVTLPPLPIAPAVSADETSNPNALSADIRRRRRKKDPRAPKKSLTSYLVFMQRHRAALAAANPDVSTQDLTTLLADKWKNVDEEERKLCEQIAASDHERWEDEMQKFTTCPPPPLPASPSEKKRKRRVKSPGAPKKPRTAYILFTMEHRKTMPGADFNDATNETAKAWQALTAEQRKIYQEQADREKEAYKAANQVYQERKALQLQGYQGYTMPGGAAVPLPFPSVGDLVAGTPGAANFTQQQLEMLQQNFNAFLLNSSIASFANAAPAAPGAAVPVVPAAAPEPQPLPALTLPAPLPSLAPPAIPISVPPSVPSTSTQGPATTGTAADQLQEFQKIKCKKGMQKAGFVEDAWHLLLDACRPQSPLYPLAVSAHEQYMKGRSRHIDYRAIMIIIFGLEKVKELQTQPAANGPQT
eukprot:jgi/Botrbrau1/2694/Bobra.0203s0037.1